MKSVEQIEKENPYGDVYSDTVFLDMLCSETITEYDGFGYFHDGEKKIVDKDIFDPRAWEENDYPYVIWYNK